MEQEREDYTDPQPRRHSWTAVEIVVLVLAIGIGAPMVVSLIAGILIGIALQGR